MELWSLLCPRWLLTLCVTLWPQGGSRAAENRDVTCPQSGSVTRLVSSCLQASEHLPWILVTLGLLLQNSLLLQFPPV